MRAEGPIAVSPDSRSSAISAGTITTVSEHPMISIARKFSRFLVSEDGSTVVHLAVLMALVAILCLAAMSSLGNAAT